MLIFGHSEAVTCMQANFAWLFKKTCVLANCDGIQSALSWSEYRGINHCGLNADADAEVQHRGFLHCSASFLHLSKHCLGILELRFLEEEVCYMSARRCLGELIRTISNYSCVISHELQQ